MSAYTIAIICVTIFVCLGNAFAVAMMAFYVSDKYWDYNKFRIWKVIGIVFEVLCVIWSPLIWVIYFLK